MSIEVKKPMSGGYITVYIFSLFMCFLSFFGRGIGVLLWGYVIWQMHKRNNQSLSSLFKGLFWFDLIGGGIGFIVLMSLGSESSISLGLGTYALIIALAAVLAYGLMIFFKNQCNLIEGASYGSASSTPKNDLTHTNSQKFYKPYENANESFGFPITVKPATDIQGMDLSGDNAWDLAIKYDPALLAAFTTIHQIDASYAEQFKHTVMGLNIYSNYHDVANEIISKAIGAELNKNRYSENELINEIINILVQKNGKSAKEFIELVKLYSLDTQSNEQTLSKTISIVKQIESLYGILVLKEVKSLQISSNDFEIKCGLYDNYSYRGFEFLQLKNGHSAIKRSSQYRVYDSLDSAKVAADQYLSQELWTNKNIVETIDR